MPTSDVVKIALEGRITAYTAAPIWRAAVDTLERTRHGQSSCENGTDLFLDLPC
jgi:hypothetical protein